MLANFLAGLSDGFTQQQQQDRDSLVANELKKLQIKVFKHELDQKDKADQAKKGLIDLMSNFIPPELTHGTSLPQDQQGPTRPMPQGQPADLRTVLQSPQGQGLALQAGFSPKELKDYSQPGFMDILSSIQGGNTNGLELSGVKFDTQGHPMLDFSKPQAGVSAPDASGKTINIYDKSGRIIGSRPAAPGEVSRTPGQQAIDTAFAKDYVDFKTLGGFSTVQKNLEQLDAVVSGLKDKKKKLTGPLTGNTPDTILQFSNPEAIKSREYVQEAVQASLRQVLGAQFTENEGVRLMARAYNPVLPPAENAARVERLIKMIKTAAQAKQEAVDYFDEHGSLEGFKGKVWSMADFSEGLDKKPNLNLGKDKSSDPLGIR